MSAIDELLIAIFAHKRPAFYSEFEGWLRASRRFRDFAHEYRNKIRAKLNNAKHVGALDDLRAELEAAALLFSEQRFEVEYERYAAAKQRGPDFTVTFKRHTAFNVEVRRLPTDPGRLAAVICEKVRQFPPSIVNLLWLAGEGQLAKASVDEAGLRLRQQAERGENGYFEKHGFAGAAEFLKSYRHLSGIVLHTSSGKAIWLNPLARHMIPGDLVAAIRRLS